MSKKEKVLYMNYGKKWDVVVKHKIFLCESDRENLYKCMDYLFDHDFVLLKRVTKRFRLFTFYIYFNTLYGGIDV